MFAKQTWKRAAAWLLTAAMVFNSSAFVVFAENARGGVTAEETAAPSEDAGAPEEIVGTEEVADETAPADAPEEIIGEEVQTDAPDEAETPAEPDAEEADPVPDAVAEPVVVDEQTPEEVSAASEETENSEPEGFPGEDKVEVLKVDGSSEVDLGEGECKWFKFVPEEDGTYILYASSDDYVDSFAELYDENFKWLADDDEGGENGAFSLDWPLEKEKTYYYKVYEYSYEPASFTVHFLKQKNVKSVEFLEDMDAEYDALTFADRLHTVGVKVTYDDGTADETINEWIEGYDSDEEVSCLEATTKVGNSLFMYLYQAESPIDIPGGNSRDIPIGKYILKVCDGSNQENSREIEIKMPEGKKLENDQGELTLAPGKKDCYQITIPEGSEKILNLACSCSDEEGFGELSYALYGIEPNKLTYSGDPYEDLYVYSGGKEVCSLDSTYGTYLLVLSNDKYNDYPLTANFSVKDVRTVQKVELNIDNKNIDAASFWKQMFSVPAVVTYTDKSLETVSKWEYSTYYDDNDDEHSCLKATTQNGDMLCLRIFLNGSAAEVPSWYNEFGFIEGAVRYGEYTLNLTCNDMAQGTAAVSVVKPNSHLLSDGRTDITVDPGEILYYEINPGDAEKYLGYSVAPGAAEDDLFAYLCTMNGESLRLEEELWGGKLLLDAHSSETYLLAVANKSKTKKRSCHVILTGEETGKAVKSLHMELPAECDALAFRNMIRDFEATVAYEDGSEETITDWDYSEHEKILRAETAGARNVELKIYQGETLTEIPFYIYNSIPYGSCRLVLSDGTEGHTVECSVEVKLPECQDVSEAETKFTVPYGGQIYYKFSIPEAEKKLLTISAGDSGESAYGSVYYNLYEQDEHAITPVEDDYVGADRERTLKLDGAGRKYLLVLSDESGGGYLTAGRLKLADVRIIESISLEEKKDFDMLTFGDQLCSLEATVTYDDGDTETVSSWDYDEIEGSGDEEGEYFSYLSAETDNGDLLSMRMYDTNGKAEDILSFTDGNYRHGMIRAGKHRIVLTADGIEQDTDREISLTQPKADVLEAASTFDLDPGEKGCYRISFQEVSKLLKLSCDREDEYDGLIRTTLYTSEGQGDSETLRLYEERYLEIGGKETLEVENGQTGQYLLVLTNEDSGNTHSGTVALAGRQKVSEAKLTGVKESYDALTFAKELYSIEASISYEGAESPEKVTAWDYDGDYLTSFTENLDELQLRLSRADGSWTNIPLFEEGNEDYSNLPLGECTLELWCDDEKKDSKNVTISKPATDTLIDIQKYSVDAESEKCYQFTVDGDLPNVLNVVCESKNASFCSATAIIYRIKEDGLIYQDYSYAEGGKAICRNLNFRRGEYLLVLRNTMQRSIEGSISLGAVKEVESAEIKNVEKSYSRIQAAEAFAGAGLEIKYKDGSAETISDWDSYWDGDEPRAFYAVDRNGEKVVLCLRKDYYDIDMPEDGDDIMDVGDYYLSVYIDGTKIVESTAIQVNAVTLADVTKLELGEETTVNLRGEESKWFGFTPSEDGSYVLKADGYVRFTLYDSHLKSLAGEMDSDYPGENIFYAELKKDSVYYCRVNDEYYSGYQSFKLKLTKEKEVTDITCSVPDKINVENLYDTLIGAETVVTYSGGEKETVREWDRSGYRNTDRLCAYTENREKLTMKLLDADGHIVRIPGMDASDLLVGAYTIKISCGSEEKSYSITLEFPVERENLESGTIRIGAGETVCRRISASEKDRNLTVSCTAPYNLTDASYGGTARVYQRKSDSRLACVHNDTLYTYSGNILRFEFSGDSESYLILSNRRNTPIEVTFDLKDEKEIESVALSGLKESYKDTELFEALLNTKAEVSYGDKSSETLTEWKSVYFSDENGKYGYVLSTNTDNGNQIALVLRNAKGNIANVDNRNRSFRAGEYKLQVYIDGKPSENPEDLFVTDAEMEGDPIELNKEAPVTLKDNISKWFAFTPSDSGEYTLHSFSDSGKTSDYDISALLYDSEGEKIGESNSYGKDFSLNCTLTAQKTYYFRIYDRYAQEASFKVKLLKKQAVTKMTWGKNLSRTIYGLGESIEIWDVTLKLEYTDGEAQEIAYDSSDWFGNEISCRLYRADDKLREKDFGLYDYLEPGEYVLVVSAGYYDYSDESYIEYDIGELEEEITVAGEHEHEWGSDWKIERDATCVETGYKMRTCTECGTRDEEEIPIAPEKHQYEWKVTTPATCSAKGVKTGICKLCWAEKTEDIPAAGHSWGAWKTTKEATVLAAGSRTRTCSVCEKTETQSIKKLTATGKVNEKSIKLKTKQSTKAVKVSGLAKGDSVKSWKSSDTKVVKVTNSGKITATSKTGKATVTITLKSGKTFTVKVTVQKTAVAASKVKIDKKSLTLKKGKSTTLKVTVTPVTCEQKAKFKSSNTKVATVDSKGKIKAKKKGKATITVTVGKKKETCKVTVK